MKIKLLLLILTFALTGCWNYRELNDLAICTGLSIDKENGEYIVNALIANSKKQGGESKESESQITIYEGNGKTITSATETLMTKLPRELYISHIDAIIISESVAKEGVFKSIDYLLRNPESRRHFYVVVAKGAKASDVIKIMSPLESFPSENIATNIKSSAQMLSSTTQINYSEFLKTLLEEGINPTLSIVEIEGNKDKGETKQNTENSTPNAIVRISKLAIFKDDKMIDIANDSETISINLLKNKGQKTSINFKCKENFYTVDINYIKVSPKPIIKNNMPSIKIKVISNGSIIEDNCDMDLNDSKTIKKIQDNTKKELKKKLQDGINITQKKYNSDILGFGQLFFKKNPNYYKSIKEAWNKNLFSNLDVSIDVDFKLKTKGAAENTVRRQKNER